MRSWETILSALASSWNPALPLAKNAQRIGPSSRRDRMLSVGTGVLSCLAIWSLDLVSRWALPVWINTRLLSSCLIFGNGLRAYKIHTTMIRHHASTRWFVANWLWWLIWLVYVFMRFSEHWRVSIDVGLNRFLIGSAAAWFQYVQSDGPFGWARRNWDVQANATIAYYFCLWLRYGGIWAFAQARWIAYHVVDILTLEAAYRLRLEVVKVFLDLAFPSHARLLADWVLLPCVMLTFVLVLFLAVPDLDWDFLQIELDSLFGPGTASSLRAKLASFCGKASALEAFWVYEFPKTIQRKRCRYEQRIRREKGVLIYKHKPLLPGEIRLLILRKPEFFYPGTITAEIVHRPLTSDLQYEALSYRWGSRDTTDEIVVSGRRLPVTRSAFELLLARRSFWHERTLWIDAVCINQRDAAEKSSQVQMIGSIYRNAFRVVLFPGNDYKYRMVAGLLDELGSVPRLISGAPGPPKLEPGVVSRWRSFADLLAAEYFSRAWVIQEITVNQNVQLYLGGIYVPWVVFRNALSVVDSFENLVLMCRYRQQQNPNVYPGLYLKNIRTMDKMRYDYDENGCGPVQPHADLMKLGNILFMTQHFRASDPREKVFAVMSITWQKSVCPDVDYNISSEKVFADTTMALVFHTDPPPIDLLALAGSSFDARTRPRSWIPDFGGQLGLRPLPLADMTVRTHRFQAAGDTIAFIRPGGWDYTISVRGIICDKILEISDVYLTELDGQEDLGGCTADFIIAANHLLRRHQAILSPNHNVGRAMIADRDINPYSSSEAELQLPGTTRQLLAFRHQENISADNMARLAEETSSLGFGGVSLINYFYSLIDVCNERRFAVSERGRLCLVPPLSRIGDEVFVPFGAQTAYVVSRRSELPAPAYELIGEAYVQGIMRGEAMHDLTQAVDIILV